MKESGTKNRKRSKRSQMSMSFGMIFSIFLIIVFIAFAFYAITKFLSIQRAAEISSFINDFQQDINKMWQGEGGNQERTYNLPSRITYVCITDYYAPKKGVNSGFYDELKQYFYETQNLFFYPVGSGEGLDAKEIQHINIKKITLNSNPFCVQNIDGKVSFTFKKGFDEALVDVEK